MRINLARLASATDLAVKVFESPDDGAAPLKLISQEYLSQAELRKMLNSNQIRAVHSRCVASVTRSAVLISCAKRTCPFSCTVHDSHNSRRILRAPSSMSSGIAERRVDYCLLLSEP